MFSFLSSIFWFAVFCGGSYKLFKSIKAENINMDLTKDKVEKLTEQSPILWGLTTLEHLNNKSNASAIALSVFIAVIGAWGIGSELLWSLIFWATLIGGVIFTLHLSAVMEDMGYKFFKFDKKFTQAQMPFFICILLFFCIPIFFSPSSGNEGSKLDTAASSDDIEYVMEREYVDKEQVQEWINRIGYKKLKLLVSQRASCGGSPFRGDCIGTDGVGEIEPTITSIEKRIACADDYTNCTSVSKWSVSRQDFKIKEDCTEAVNKKAKKNVMRLYQFAEWPRVDKWNGATITWYNFDAGYKCTYSLADKTISVSTT
jgi:hypothetical protein